MLLINYNKSVILQFKMAEEPTKQKTPQQTVLDGQSNPPNQSTELKLPGGLMKSSETEGNSSAPRIEKRVSFEAITEIVQLPIASDGVKTTVNNDQASNPPELAAGEAKTTTQVLLGKRTSEARADGPQAVNKVIKAPNFDMVDFWEPVDAA